MKNVILNEHKRKKQTTNVISESILLWNYKLFEGKL